MEQSRELFSNIRGRGGASNADIRSQDLGLPDEYSLGHRGHYNLLLLDATEAASPVRLVWPRPDHFSAGRWSHSQTAETV